MRKTMLVLLACGLAGVLSSCASSGGVRAAGERDLTVGIVQKEIKEGMAGADVAAALGSPNIVTRDSQGRESWIYDKVASESYYANTSGGVGGSLAGAGIAGETLLMGKAGGNVEGSKGSSASTQRTLTVIIRFDENGNVANYSYHSSKF